jgi:zinc/manganese transport system substrate-binding protein
MSRRAWWTVVVALVLAGCGASTTGGSGVIRVVAGESFWGSVASQLGGSRVDVQSVVTDPNADPHEYESSANDARAFAEANLVILTAPATTPGDRSCWTRTPRRAGAS